MPNTHRQRDSTVRVGSCRRRRCEQHSQLAHDDCRRIRSAIWKLTKQTPYSIAVWLREFWSISITFWSLCRHLSPTSVAKKFCSLFQVSVFVSGVRVEITRANNADYVYFVSSVSLCSGGVVPRPTQAMCPYSWANRCIIIMTWTDALRTPENTSSTAVVAAAARWWWWICKSVWRHCSSSWVSSARQLGPVFNDEVSITAVVISFGPSGYERCSWLFLFLGCYYQIFHVLKLFRIENLITTRTPTKSTRTRTTFVTIGDSFAGRKNSERTSTRDYAL